MLPARKDCTCAHLLPLLEVESTACAATLRLRPRCIEPCDPEAGGRCRWSPPTRSWLARLPLSQLPDLRLHRALLHSYLGIDGHRLPDMSHRLQGGLIRRMKQIGQIVVQGRFP